MTFVAYFLAFLASATATDAMASENGRADLFDPPLRKKVIQLADAPFTHAGRNPQGTLLCAYYPSFVVKQIDHGWEGADQLSVIPLPADQGEIECLGQNMPNEKVLDWYGYFTGVKGNYVLFSGGGYDERYGGVPFAIYNGLSGHQIFVDGYGGNSKGNFQNFRLTPTSISFRYERSYHAPCSLVAEAHSCWKTIKQATGLKNATPPDCTEAYKPYAGGKELTQGLIEDPSDISYTVKVTVALGGGHKFVVPTPNKIGCSPTP